MARCHADDQQQQYVRPQHIGRILLDVLIEYAADHVGMHLHSGIDLADRRGAHIHQSRRGSSHQHDLVFHFCQRGAFMQHVGRGNITEGAARSRDKEPAH